MSESDFDKAQGTLMVVPGRGLNVTRSSSGGLKTTLGREHITMSDHIVAFCFALVFDFYFFI